MEVGYGSIRAKPAIYKCTSILVEFKKPSGSILPYVTGKDILIAKFSNLRKIRGFAHWSKSFTAAKKARHKVIMEIPQHKKT